MADDKALKILFDAFWVSGKGWKDGSRMGACQEDFAYAKSKGVMFDHVTPDHDRVLGSLLATIGKLNRRRVSDAFLASLSSRRLDWRSALGSYAVFQHLPDHKAKGGQIGCTVCGGGPSMELEDLNELNFERFKWGGVRHDHVLYAAMDLALFLKDPAGPPNRADIEIFKSIVSSIERAPLEVTSAALHSQLVGLLKSNKAERDMIVAILGYCGILEDPAHTGFSDRFVPPDEREIPGRRFVDMPYPACWWKREHGINRARLNEYFGYVL